MSRFISHIATVEIPVSDLNKSVEFYVNVLGVTVLSNDGKQAMLSFAAKGVPTIFLVETTDDRRLTFTNTNKQIEHSIIDFFTPDLHAFYNWLKEQGISVSELNIDEKSGLGGFGFKDPDGNQLSACNILHPNQ